MVSFDRCHDGGSRASYTASRQTALPRSHAPLRGYSLLASFYLAATLLTTVLTPKANAQQPADAPPKIGSKLPQGMKAVQSENLQSPADILKPPRELGAAQCPLVPGRRVIDQYSTDLCDQNVPPVPCPSSKDAQDLEAFVRGVQDPKTPLTVYLGRTRLLDLNQIPKRVQIGDEKIVDFAYIPPRQISLLPKKEGTTVLNLWFVDPLDKTQEKTVGYLVRVLPDPEEKARLEDRYKKLAAEINCQFPDSRVCLTLVGDKLVVSGEAKDVADATHILRIARSHVPYHLVDEAVSPGGTAGRTDYANRRGRYPELDDVAGNTIINQLHIPGEQTVLLKVTVAEINRSAARSIGLNFSLNRNGMQFANTTGNIAGNAINAAGAGAGAVQGGIFGNMVQNVGNNAASAGNQAANNLPLVLDNGKLTLAIDALKSLSYARTLAEPTLTTQDGQPATFHAGGQFPVPIVTANGISALQDVKFENFGVQLSFTPFIIDRDRIQVNLSGSISARDLSSGASIGGSTVAGINTRSFQSVVTLRHGQTFLLAGLIQNNLGAQTNRIPFLGDVPILNRVLGFDQLNAGEQELVVLVTPVLQHPLNPDEMSPLPGSDLFEPSDLEFYVLGRIESRREHDYRTPVRTDPHRMLNYRHCEDIYIYGPSGHSEPTHEKAPAK